MLAARTSMNVEGSLAWIVAAAVSAVMLRRVRTLSQVDKPSAETLLEEVKAAAPELTTTEGTAPAAALDASAVRHLELDERLIEIQASAPREPELASALSRVALASGTALALLALIRDGALVTRTIHGAVALMAGVVGAGVVSYLGRVASVRARDIREHWLRIGNDVRRTLGP